MSWKARDRGAWEDSVQVDVPRKTLRWKYDGLGAGTRGNFTASHGIPWVSTAGSRENLRVNSRENPQLPTTSKEISRGMSPNSRNYTWDFAGPAASHDIEGDTSRDATEFHGIIPGISPLVAGSHPGCRGKPQDLISRDIP